MDRFLTVCFLVSCIYWSNVVCQQLGDNVSEVEMLKVMLRRAFLQIRNLEQQNYRLKIIWSGLHQMCSALRLPPCDCGASEWVDVFKMHENKTSVSGRRLHETNQIINERPTSRPEVVDNSIKSDINDFSRKDLYIGTEGIKTTYGTFERQFIDIPKTVIYINGPQTVRITDDISKTAQNSNPNNVIYINHPGSLSYRNPQHTADSFRIRPLNVTKRQPGSVDTFWKYNTTYKPYVRENTTYIDNIPPRNINTSAVKVSTRQPSKFWKYSSTYKPYTKENTRYIDNITPSTTINTSARYIHIPDIINRGGGWKHIETRDKLLHRYFSSIVKPPTGATSGKGTNTKGTNHIFTGTPLTSTDTKSPIVDACKETSQKLSLISVASGGLSDNSVNVSVNYTAPREHTTEWIVPRNNYGTFRTSGVQYKHMDGPCRSHFSSQISVIHLNETKHVVFRIYTDNQSRSIHMNLSVIQVKGTQLIMEPDISIDELKSVYSAPMDSDLQVNVIANGNPGHIIDLAESDIYLTGLNTSTSPPSPFEIRSSWKLSLQPRSNLTTDISITLQKRYIKYGGVLTIRLSQNIGGKIELLSHGYSSKILSPVTREVVPYNSVGVFPLPKQTAIVTPSQNIVCAAIGNPRPNVSILKISNEGVLTELETETIQLDSMHRIEVLNLFTDTTKSVEGYYMCRAESGRKRVETITEAILMKPVTFNDVITGVTVNTTKKVVITCEASGSPVPNLEMRLYFESGPDLIKAGLFTVSKTLQGKDTVRLTLAMSPVDRDVSIVHCAALQKGIFKETDTYRTIELFPGTSRAYNFEFYSRVQQLANLNK